MGWQPIETAPKNGTVILIFGVYVGYPIQHVVEWRKGRWKVDTEDGWWGVVVDPTHWMPLPNPPLADSDGLG